MQQLSSLDTSFLSLESSRSPMHIGCILTFAAPRHGKMTFERFKLFVASRLPSSPVFRRRLSRLPLDLGRPYWVEDAHFDINNHVLHVASKKSDGLCRRSVLVDHFFSERLPLDRPLWQMLFIDAPEESDSGFTVLLKIHHCAVDGVSAEKILSGLLSTEPEFLALEEDTWSPEHPLVSVMAADTLRALYHAPSTWLSLSKNSLNALKQSHKLRERDKQQRPPLFFTSPESFFNQEVEANRQINSVHLSLRTIKTIKENYVGCKVNDVVLAICAGALRKHLISLDALPDKPLVAMVPVSKRSSGETNQGNLVSPMLISLATDIASPRERLEVIQKNALQAKEYNQKVALEQLLMQLPSWPAALATKAYTKLRLAKRLKPVFNVIITNVPGAPCPLYLDGAQLKTMEGMAPIVDGMGLTLVVTSYHDSLTIAVTSTAAMAIYIPDFIDYLEESLEELSALVSMPVPIRNDLAIAL